MILPIERDNSYPLSPCLEMFLQLLLLLLRMILEIIADVGPILHYNPKHSRSVAIA